MKSPSLGRQKLVLRLAFLIIVLVSALAFYSTQRLIAASERVERTQNMLVETNRFLSEIRAVESSSWGYFVTGDDRFLKVRAASLANVKMTGRLDATGLEGRGRRFHPQAIWAERAHFRP